MYLFKSISVDNPACVRYASFTNSGLPDETKWLNGLSVIDMTGEVVLNDTSTETELKYKGRIYPTFDLEYYKNGKMNLRCLDKTDSEEKSIEVFVPEKSRLTVLRVFGCNFDTDGLYHLLKADSEPVSGFILKQLKIVNDPYLADLEQGANTFFTLMYEVQSNSLGRSDIDYGSYSYYYPRSEKLELGIRSFEIYLNTYDEKFRQYVKKLFRTFGLWIPRIGAYEIKDFACIGSDKECDWILNEPFEHKWVLFPLSGGGIDICANIPENEDLCYGRRNCQYTDPTASDESYNEIIYDDRSDDYCD